MKLYYYVVSRWVRALSNWLVCQIARCQPSTCGLLKGECGCVAGPSMLYVFLEDCTYGVHDLI